MQTHMVVPGWRVALIFYSPLTAGNSRRDHGDHRPAKTRTCPKHSCNPPNEADRVMGTRSCALMQMDFWLCQHTLWNTLPWVRCICNEVWECCPICILNRPTDNVVHTASVAVRAQHDPPQRVVARQRSSTNSLLHSGQGFLVGCHSFNWKLTETHSQNPSI